MQKRDAAAFLAGVSQVEGSQAANPTNLHVISGEVGERSEDGKAKVAIDGLVFSEEDDQYVEIDTLGGLEEGDVTTVILTGESGHAMTPLAIGAVGSVDRLKARVVDTELLLADKADIEDLEAATARIGDLEADHVSVDTLEAATARIQNLEVDHVSVADFEVEQANIDSLQAATADIDTIRANSAKVQNLTAAQLEADHAKVGQLDVDQIAADHATIGTLDTTYMHANMSNSDVAWIENGTIKDGSIVSAMINDVSANKLTAGTINGSVINVTNLNADNITAGTINGQRIGEGSLSLDKLSEDVYTEAEVNTIVDGLNDRIDGAIETFTGTAVPTLNNSPASAWNTTKLRDEHVGDVYYVVNSQSQQNGYCYRFTKSGSTYSWQLIKDSDVTAALSRLTTAEGKITSIESFDSTVSSFMTNTDDELTSIKSRATSLETRMTDAEGDISDKVDTSTFNTLSQTVDTNTASITSLSSTVSQKADGSTVTALTNRVSTVEQDVDGIETRVGSLETTIEDKADGSTVETISSRLNTVSDTVDGHTSQLSSITSTQTSMQSTLDKTVKSSIQLWYSKANTTAPSKPTSQVTSTSTSGNAWRIVVPAYNASYPHYYYCWQYEYTDGTYGWSAVVRDIAMGESQSTARTADSNASAAVTTANTASTNASTALSTANTANTNASDAKAAAATASTTASEAKTTAETAASDASTAKTNAASAVSTANSASTTATNAQSTANANIKSSVQLWFTKANSTAPSKPTSVVSTSNANTANAWNLVVPVWNSSYPHYFYCYQQQKGDGNYQWTDVVYDRATSEAQQLANTTSTNLSTLQTNYATFKQQTEQFESTVGTTYATKTELKGATDDITELEGRVSTNETSISNNSSAIALKANSSDVYTKTAVDGKITQEVSDRNAAITAKANEITSTVSQNYTTKQEFENLEIGGRNLALNTAGVLVDKTEMPDGSRYEYFYFDLGRALPFGAGTPIVISFDLYMPIKSSYPRFLVYNTNCKGPHQTLSNIDVLSGKNLPVGSVVDERIVIETSVYADRSDSTLPNDYLEFYSNYGSNNYYRISNLKLEKGNKATDWTPAPEDIEERVSSAESAITQNAQNIELKVSKDGVISSINQSAETVKIQASKVEIDGTAIFTAISSDVDDAITGKGYQTSSQVESAITSKGYQTSSQVNSAITSKGYATTTQAQGYATTAKSEAISAAANDATNKANEAYEKIQSRGVQLVTNGNGYMRDNTNWPALTFDGTKANGSPGSFTKSISYSNAYSEEAFPIDVEKQYVFEFDAISSDGTGRLYAFLPTYDVDDNAIVATNVMYIPGTLTTLASDLNPGDTTVKLTSAAGWKTPTSYAYQRSLIFWDYKNSNGYTYPPETYSRNFYSGAYSDDSKVNKSTGVITLASAWSGPKKPAGTQVSQGNDGGTYAYSMANVQVPSTWTHYYATINGLDTTKDGVDQFGKFRQGSAFARVGFIWNYGVSGGNQGQIWVTNVSVKEATVNQATLTEVKNNAVKRTQRIWYRTNASSAPATPGTSSSNWVTKADDGNNAWTKMHVAISSSAKYIYTCEQYEMADGTVGYTDVLLDNTITVIDGGNIITGSVNANAISASSGTFDVANIPNLSAAKITSGTIDAARIDASHLTIGQSQVTGLTTTLNGKADTSDIPTNVSDLTNDSGFQTSTQVESAITSKGYATTTQAQGYATTAKSEAISAAATDATTKANAAAKTATSYVTEITGQNGIMVHPSTDDDTGVRITSDVDIMRNGNSILNVGTQGDTTSTDAGVTIYDGEGNDSSNIIARLLGTGAQIGRDADIHVSVDGNSLDVLKGTNNRQLITMRDSGDAGYVGATYFDEDGHEHHGAGAIVEADPDGSRMIVEINAEYNDSEIDINNFNGRTNMNINSMDSIRFSDPYDSSLTTYLQLGDPTRYQSSGSYAITTAGIDTYTNGPRITIPAGSYMFVGAWTFNSASASGDRNMQVGFRSGASGTLWGERVRIRQSSGNFAVLNVSALRVFTSETTVYLAGSASITSGAGDAWITAVRLN